MDLLSWMRGLNVIKAHWNPWRTNRKLKTNKLEREPLGMEKQWLVKGRCPLSWLLCPTASTSSTHLLGGSVATNESYKIGHQFHVQLPTKLPINPRYHGGGIYTRTEEARPFQFSFPSWSSLSILFSFLWSHLVCPLCHSQFLSLPTRALNKTRTRCTTEGAKLLLFMCVSHCFPSLVDDNALLILSTS